MIKNYNISIPKWAMFLMVSMVGMVGFSQHRSVKNIAGTGIQGYGGDGGLAENAIVGAAWGVTEDNSGNIFFSDLSNGRIRRIDGVTGIITTVAGTTPFGSFNGDGILATSASLGLPAGIVVDDQGNIFISDLIQHRIRKIDYATGMINTIVGNGTTGYNGDGMGDTVTISAPTQIVLDQFDNLIFSDVGNFCIRRVDQTGMVTTLAGVPGSSGPATPGSAALSTPIAPKGGVAVDGSGNVYFVNDNNKILKINSAGVIELIAGTGSAGFSGDGGPAINAKINDVYGIKYSNGYLYLADKGNFRIRQIDLTTGIINTVVGTGVGTYNGEFLLASQTNINPFDMHVRGNGDMLITDNGNYYIRVAYDCFNPDLPVLGASKLKGCPGDTIKLFVEDGDLNNGSEWVWRSACFAGDSIFGGPVFEFVLDNNSITFYCRGEGECADNALCSPITIESKCDEYHNAFSPNNDGYNDYWVIPLLDVHPENEVTIFNRWGDEIMYIQNYNNIDRYWEGSSYDVELVPSGTYYFTITSSDGFELNGWVQVVK